MRAITHIHTEYSWDGKIPISTLASRLVESGVELAVVTDHNDFGGSLALRELAESEGLPIQVPLAAEIRTDRGDMIAVLPGTDPPDVASLLQWPSFHEVVRERGGIIWLAHPYRSHQGVDELAAEADVIEVFNARCSDDENRRAAELCERFGKVPAFGADVHRVNELTRFTVDYEPGDDILETLLVAPTCEAPQRTRRSDIMAAEVTNGIKRRRLTLVGYFSLRWIQSRAVELLASRERR